MLQLYTSYEIPEFNVEEALLWFQRFYQDPIPGMGSAVSKFNTFHQAESKPIRPPVAKYKNKVNICTLASRFRDSGFYNFVICKKKGSSRLIIRIALQKLSLRGKSMKGVEVAIGFNNIALAEGMDVLFSGILQVSDNTTTNASYTIGVVPIRILPYKLMKDIQFPRNNDKELTLAFNILNYICSSYAFNVAANSQINVSPLYNNCNETTQVYIETDGDIPSIFPKNVVLNVNCIGSYVRKEVLDVCISSIPELLRRVNYR